MNIQTVKNVSDCVPLYLPHSLYLKPYAKINISITLPVPVPGKSISNWDLMEQMKKIILPDVFSVLKVTKSTLEYIRFEAEVEDHEKLRKILSRLDGQYIRLSGFSENVKVRATEAKIDFPTRHDWDTFFRDARDMDEMKPGERPDTIYISHLPVRWFCPRHMENDKNVKPSESIFKRIFERFGEVRLVDIPLCDPYRQQMKSHISGIKTFSFDQEEFFEGYVQFSEYISFIRAMDAFRGMKLIRKEGDKNLAVNITMNFDTTKHLSDVSVKRRNIVRDRIIAKEKALEEEENRKLKEEEEKKERERRRQEELKQQELQRQREREEKRKEKQLQKLREKEKSEIDNKIRAEEKKLMIAQRKLESFRILEVLFERIKVKCEAEKSIKSEPIKKEKESKRAEKNKILKKLKVIQQKELEKQRTRLKKTKEGKSILTQILYSRSRSPSITSISTADSIISETGKKKKKKNHDTKDSDENSKSSDSEKGNMHQKNVIGYGQNFPLQPLYNPENGEWLGMGVYPYGAPFIPQTAGIPRPGFFPTIPYRGVYRGPRSRFPRIRGRGTYRGRGGGYYNPYYKNKDEKYEKRSDEHDHRSRSKSSSRSYSRSRSRSSSRSSRSKRSKTHKSYSKGRTKTKSSKKSNTSGKLVSTLRRSNSSSEFRSRSSRDSRSWSSSNDSYASKKGKRRRARSWSRRSRSRSHRRGSHEKASEIILEPEKLVQTAKEIQKKVQKKLRESLQKKDNNVKQEKDVVNISAKDDSYDTEEDDYERSSKSEKTHNSKKDERSSRKPAKHDNDKHRKHKSSSHDRKSSSRKRSYSEERESNEKHRDRSHSKTDRRHKKEKH